MKTVENWMSEISELLQKIERESTPLTTFVTLMMAREEIQERLREIYLDHPYKDKEEQGNENGKVDL